MKLGRVIDKTVKINYEFVLCISPVKCLICKASSENFRRFLDKTRSKGRVAFLRGGNYHSDKFYTILFVSCVAKKRILIQDVAGRIQKADQQSESVCERKDGIS